MAKFTMQWKDPDYVYDMAEMAKAMDLADKRYDKQTPEEKAKWETAWKKLHDAGLGEYIVVEFDADTGVATIVKDE